MCNPFVFLLSFLVYMKQTFVSGSWLKNGFRGVMKVHIMAMIIRETGLRVLYMCRWVHETVN